MIRRFSMLLLIVFILLVIISGIVIFRTKPVASCCAAHKKTLIIAHRGGGGLWPENTIYAFRRAVGLGVDILEMDVYGTKDGELVLMHDSTVERVTNGSGPVQDFTLAELKKLDAGYNWTDDGGQSFPFRGQGIVIPTLEEVFKAFSDVRMSIEIKQVEPSITKTLCRLIRDYKKTGQVVVGSFYSAAIEEFRRICPEVATSASKPEIQLFCGLLQNGSELNYMPPAHVFQIPERKGGVSIAAENFVNTAHKYNIDVHVYTINDVNSMRRIIEMGVDGIITDYPDRLKAVLGQ